MVQCLSDPSDLFIGHFRWNFWHEAKVDFDVLHFANFCYGFFLCEAKGVIMCFILLIFL